MPSVHCPLSIFFSNQMGSLSFIRSFRYLACMCIAIFTKKAVELKLLLFCFILSIHLSWTKNRSKVGCFKVAQHFALTILQRNHETWFTAISGLLSAAWKWWLQGPYFRFSTRIGWQFRCLTIFFTTFHLNDMIQAYWTYFWGCKK